MFKKEIVQTGVTFKNLTKENQKHLIQQVLDIKTDEGVQIYTDAEMVLSNGHFDDRRYTIFYTLDNGVVSKFQIEEE
tara:strand:- start:3616 stop:3846 length:231 start_codon:yes stop_codon:yes gene_type:complete